MAVSRAALEEQIKDALVNAGRDWADAQKNVLDGLATNNTKLFGAPPMFQAAAWLNMGLSATKALFPNSAFAGAISKLSIPIAIVNYAMEGFRHTVSSKDDPANALLRHDYQSLRDEFQKQIVQVPRDIANTPFGVQICTEMLAILNRRANEFVDVQMAYSHCANMITHVQHGVVETDGTAIQKRSAEGFLALCNKIYDVYRGIYGGGGGLNSLTHVNPDKQVCYVETGRGPLSRRPQTDPFTGQTAACGPEFDLVALGNTVRREAEMKRLLGDIGRYDVMYLSAWQQDHVYVRPSRLVMEVDGHTSSYAKSDLSSIRGSLENADRAEWPRTLRVRAGGV